MPPSSSNPSSSSNFPGSSNTEQPLLTLAIPTHNRADYLRELLAELGPQLIALAHTHPGQVELLVSDNGSTDGTPAVLDAAELTGVPLRRIRQPENIGSDRNFVFCFRHARGRYFWLCGDDDILRPGAVATVLDSIRTADFDWIYLPPEPFQTHWQQEFRPDPHSRGSQVIHSARELALRVNVMITFISATVVNRDRLLTLAAEPPEAFIGTHLTQLSWTLPLLRDHRKSLILWQRFVLGRRMNSGGYSVAQVFGSGFAQAVQRLLPDRPRVAAVFLNLALRQWFPATVLELRQSGNGTRFHLHEADHLLRHAFRRNFRFWLFTWPVLRLPLPLASGWHRTTRTAGRLLRFLQHPGDIAVKLRSRKSARTS